MTRELEGLEEGPKLYIHIDLLKMTLKKYQTGKRQAMMEYMASGSKIHLHSRQTSTRNEQMPTKSTCTQIDNTMERPHWSKKIQTKEPPLTTTDP